MPPVLRFRPGIQATDSTDTATQRRAIGEALDRTGVRIDLGGGHTTSGAELAQMTDAELRALGFDASDVFEAADDLALDANRGTTVALAGLAAQLGLRDGTEANYANAFVAPDGTPLVVTRNVGGPSDRNWRATRRWDADEIAAFRRFVPRYVAARVAAHDRVNCADLAVEMLIAYARQRGLPIELERPGVRITNDTPHSGFCRWAQQQFRARDLPGGGNSVPVAVSDVLVGDFGIYSWNQSLDGRDSPYQHTSNPLVWDPEHPWRTVAAFGSLEDIVKQRVIDAFNARFGTNFTVRDLDEYGVIDPITGDQGRGVSPEAQREIALSQLRRHGIAAPTEDHVREFLAMINGPGNIIRDADTEVHVESGAYTFDWMTGRDLWSDTSLVTSGLRQLNTDFRIRRRLTPSDVRPLLAAADADAQEAAARSLLQARGVPTGRLEAAVDQLMAVVDGSRMLRRWNFMDWNRLAPGT